MMKSTRWHDDKMVVIPHKSYRTSCRATGASAPDTATDPNNQKYAFRMVLNDKSGKNFINRYPPNNATLHATGASRPCLNVMVVRSLLLKPRCAPMYMVQMARPVK